MFSCYLSINVKIIEILLDHLSLSDTGVCEEELILVEESEVKQGVYCSKCKNDARYKI